MTDSNPRVGDTITTAAGLDALPVGSVVLDRFGDEATRQPTRLWAYPETAHQTSAYLAKHFAPLEVLHLPGAPQPDPTTDAVERAARALYFEDCGVAPDEAILRSEEYDTVFREHARIALAAARAGEAVDREALTEVLSDMESAGHLGSADFDRCADACPACGVEQVRAILAARGGATPTEVEWGVRYPSGNVDVKPEARARAVAERYADVPNDGAPVLMRRTVSAWREVR